MRGIFARLLLRLALLILLTFVSVFVLAALLRGLDIQGLFLLSLIIASVLVELFLVYWAALKDGRPQQLVDAQLAPETWLVGLPAEYRQKLLNWYCSLLVLFSTFFAAMAAFWLFFIPRPRLAEEHEFGFEIVFYLADVSLVFAFLLFPALLWHLSDFMHKIDNSAKSIWARFSLYPVWITCFGLTCTAVALILSQSLASPCGRMPAGMHFAFRQMCSLRPPDWLYIVLFLTSGSTVFLAVWKLAATLTSRRPKHTK